MINKPCITKYESTGHYEFEVPSSFRKDKYNLYTFSSMEDIKLLYHTLQEVLLPTPNIIVKEDWLEGEFNE